MAPKSESVAKWSTPGTETKEADGERGDQPFGRLGHVPLAQDDQDRTRDRRKFVVR